MVEGVGTGSWAEEELGPSGSEARLSVSGSVVVYTPAPTADDRPVEIERSHPNEGAEMGHDLSQTALLHSVGPECLRIYNGMKFATEADSFKCSVTMDKFNTHFLGESREFFERFKFNQRNQESGESIEQPLNIVLKREHYPLPVLDDILPQLSDATVFSICDLKDGYLHCKLGEESTLLTTFATLWGRYRWKRLPFGLKVSSKIFQKRLHQALDGLPGVCYVAHDIVIWGSTDAEHDARLHWLLKRCQAVGIVLNKEKCQFRLKEISFLGHIVSNSGLKPDPLKIEAILNMTDPSCKDDIHRLRGMIQVRYLKGEDNVLADALSRASLPHESGQHDLEVVNAVNHLALPDDKIAEIKRQTVNDPTVCQLKDTILEGWPDHKSQLPQSLTPYFGFRDEVSLSDDLIFKGERLVVPKQVRQKMKEELHRGHNGVDSTLRRARDHLYWPGMSKEIKEFIQTCATCQENSISQPAQPLMPHQIIGRPWAKVESDLFHHCHDNYLLMVCYYSNFFEMEKLQRTTAPAVIKKLKHHFGRYGVPEIIVSDNGPPFSSREFAKKNLELSTKPSLHTTAKLIAKQSLLSRLQKRLLTRCKDTGDVDLALLNIRNIPTQGIQSSLAQGFMGRRTRTLIPTSTRLLAPDRNPQADLERLKESQKRQAKYFNRETRKLKDLSPGAVVRVKPFNNDKKWKKAVILKKLDDRSYEVRCEDQVLRRNREHLRATSEPQDVHDTGPVLFNWRCSDGNPQPDVPILSTILPILGPRYPRPRILPVRRSRVIQT
ncbi:uncharacterized protein K02A2.6-like [Lytechinus variegatus]|uniref:uncharacterized protein K02A2.6-like n=1 Tax=Lytechinus variegatus TaxID=7654 RepID=UPI001BB1E192|nr:uncharacterized protein K02A2.6-like [Lytechinus variegatus]